MAEFEDILNNGKCRFCDAEIPSRKKYAYCALPGCVREHRKDYDKKYRGIRRVKLSRECAICGILFHTNNHQRKHCYNEECKTIHREQARHKSKKVLLVCKYCGEEYSGTKRSTGCSKLACVKAKEADYNRSYYSRRKSKDPDWRRKRTLEEEVCRKRLAKERREREESNGITCRRCGKQFFYSPIKKVRRQFCDECRKAKAKEANILSCRKRKTDLPRRLRYNTRHREYYQRLKQDPVRWKKVKEKNSAYAKKWYASLMNDPVRKERLRKQRREYARLRREKIRIEAEIAAAAMMRSATRAAAGAAKVAELWLEATERDDE